MKQNSYIGPNGMRNIYVTPEQVLEGIVQKYMDARDEEIVQQIQFRVVIMGNTAIFGFDLDEVGHGMLMLDIVEGQRYQDGNWLVIQYDVQGRFYFESDLMVPTSIRKWIADKVGNIVDEYNQINILEVSYRNYN